MKTTITFCDIAHREHTAKVIPLGISMIAAYAYKHFKDKINVEIFKSADSFTQYIDKNIPRVACFANYIWNANLSYQTASRIKKRDQRTVTVFGGPNYSLNEVQEQKDFLISHPNIDFYIVGEGEEPFVNLLKELFKYNFDVQKIKEQKLKIGGCHYIVNGEFITSPMPKPIANLDDIPSPYLLGFLDKHLGGDLKPLMQTTRGCPFSCTFCQEGADYYNKVRRFSLDRVKSEILYLARHSKSKTLSVADSNFGMYKQDIDICKEIASSMKTHNWPLALEGIQGKNKKERVLEATSIIGHTSYSAAIQSTDKNVLKEIKRANVSGEAMLDVVKEAKRKTQSTSFSELILGLPGDSKKGHFQSNIDLLDSEVNVVRSHQFIMLPASPASSIAERKQHGLITKFRVVPKTVELYKMFGEEFYAPEIDEICVGSKTLPHKDYLECRLFNLTVEMFYNNGIFDELIELLKYHGLKISSFMLDIHETVQSSKQLNELYENFLRETKELYDTREEIENLLKDEKILKKYISLEMGNNEQLVYRSVGVLEMMEELHKIAFGVAKKMLLPKMELTDQAKMFFNEFESFSLMQKKDMLAKDQNNIRKKKFHFDFISFFKSNFKKNPSELYVLNGINFEFNHTQKQKELIHDYFNIYGDSKDGVAYIFATALASNNMYRKASYSN